CYRESTPTSDVTKSFFRDLPTPAQNLRLGTRGFGFLDVTGPIVKERETGPADLIVRPEFDRFFAGLDCLVETPQFHQRHAERVPAVEEFGIHLNTTPVFLHGAFQIAYGEIAVRVVKEFVERFHLFSLAQPTQRSQGNTENKRST